MNDTTRLCARIVLENLPPLDGCVYSKSLINLAFPDGEEDKDLLIAHLRGRLAQVREICVHPASRIRMTQKQQCEFLDRLIITIED